MDSEGGVRTLAVVVPTRGRRARLPTVILPLLEDPVISQVVVVVDGSDDGSIEWLRETATNHPHLVPVVREQSGGAQAARALGLEQVTEEVVLFLDDDVLAGPGLAAGHLRHQQSGPGTVVVGFMPVVLPETRRAGEFATYLYADEYLKRCRIYEEDPEQILRSLWWGNVSMRRSDAEAVGLVSPGHEKLYHEDQDFGLRCLDAGLVGVFDRSLATQHLHTRDIDAFIRDARSQGAGRALLHDRHETRLGPLDLAEFEVGLPSPAALLVRSSGHEPVAAAATAVLRLSAQVAGRVGWFGAETGSGKLLRRVNQRRGAEDVIRGDDRGERFPDPERDEVGRVSVCVSSHNYGRYVADAVQSALDQSYPDVEVIIVDDGSTDDSLEVLSAFGDRISLIPQENAGQFATCRAGFEHSTGDVVIFLDADDLLDRDTVARVVAALGETPGAGRIQWRLRVIGADGSPTADLFPPAAWTLPSGDLRTHVLARRTYVWPPTSGNAFRRDVLDLVFSSIEDEDPLIDLILAETTPLIGPVVTLAGEGGSYRWHGENFSTSSRRDLTEFLHDRVNETVEHHRIVGRVCKKLAIAAYPPDPTAALDWAFAGYRLSSLRNDAATHPLPDDRRVGVALHGIRSVATQPDYSVTAKVKRVVWFAALAVAPVSVTRRLIEKAYLAPPTTPTGATTGGASTPSSRA